MSWKNLKRYYVYTYFDNNKIPYYVGMGCKKRVIQKHLYVKVPIFENIEIIDDLDQQTAWENPEYKESRLKKIKEKPFAHKGKPWSKARRDAQMKKQNKNNEVSK